MANVKNPNDILVGTGRVYIDGYDIGQIDGDVGFKHGKEYFEKKSGFPAQTVKKVKIGETCTLDFNLLEANLATIRKLMPEYVEVTGVDGVATATDEVVTAYQASHSALAHGQISSVTSVKNASDEALVEGTDYEIDKLAGTIYRVGTSTKLLEGGAIKITYEYKTFASAGFGFGGGSSTDQTFRMEFWHKKSDGKYRHLTILKCQIDGDFTMGFKEQADSPIPITVTALADSSQPAGRQLGTVVDVDASAAPDGGW